MDKVKACQKCGKQFRLIEMELSFYEKNGYPEPDYCPNCREARREALRSTHQFFKRPCGKCGKEIITTHDPEKGRIVFCEKCYSEYYNLVDPLLKKDEKIKAGSIKEMLDVKLAQSKKSK